MWLQKNSSWDKKDGVNGIVAVGIDKDKGSQNALKWAIDHLLTRNNTVVLIHVNAKHASVTTPKAKGFGFNEHNSLVSKDPDDQTKEIFRPYRVFCARKDGSDIPGTISKGAPDFCTIYVVSKGKIQSMRSASRPVPFVSPLLSQLPQTSLNSDQSDPPRVPLSGGSVKGERRPLEVPPRRSHDGTTDSFRSPFTRKGMAERYVEISTSADSDITFVSSGRSSIDKLFPTLTNNNTSESCFSNPRLSYSSDTDANYSFESLNFGRRSIDITSPDHSFSSDGFSSSSQTTDDVEAEMRRLKLELKQTMEMYSTACKEALSAQHMAVELQRWKIEEEKRMEEARMAEEAALAMAERERAKSKAAIETAEAQKRIAELEAQKRLNAEMKALKESEERRRAIDALANKDVRYRRYSIEEIEEATSFFTEALKIGEGGYGPVYKCLLDHTPVAVKVLRPDAAQGRSQFQREVEVLSCIRHPNMVLLLGACPEYGCLVYEHMSRGSLDDVLFCRGNSPALPWQLRFKIVCEIGTGLLFLHQTKPEPLVHRDLKPANILLDRNYVAKISDVGLARLVPPSVANNVTQYRMTSAAGTFCYIDPEYQQTGMLGVKSDIYSLGIIFLQILTARPPMGLTHHVDRAIEKGKFVDMLDSKVCDWPIEEALTLAKIAIKCAELRRKDRPDLGKEVLPELNRLRELAESNDQHSVLNGFISPSNLSQVSVQDGGCSSHPSSGEST
ncbi:unnamed protein product [Lupinus luteus]|uniref:RING-type E3 ubiquitin transferase n=1 Tax=Lupinus luteus TaxID=3873 RepID=A0AAV1YHM7_LUPLU